jgi:hypothetical protein
MTKTTKNLRGSVLLVLITSCTYSAFSKDWKSVRTRGGPFGNLSPSTRAPPKRTRASALTTGIGSRSTKCEQAHGRARILAGRVGRLV